MNKFIIILSLMILFASSCSAGDYILRPGDVLSINVFGYPEQSLAEVTIRPDGKLALPLLGEINADGISVGDFTRNLSESLGRYYVNPQVSMNILRYSTMRVYVLGEVNKQGLYELSKSRTLLDAIGMAEGWTKDAAKTKVFIIRKDNKGEPLRANLLDLLKKGDISQNYSLQEGDAIYLSGNNRIDVIRDVVPVIEAIGSAVSTAYNINNFKGR